ncbi:hypothetical protein JCM9279_004206 [Rhodotorula babjevae]
MAEQGPHISIAAGIVIGLVASFVQSLGLTVQRLSHISNERQPIDQRRRDWQRPLWLVGFAVFILSNVFGTLFQIGALPIVVLGPLGAVSLLWNAFFARIILGDSFTVQLAVGSILIAGGATLVGIFGVVPEQTHTLPELIELYRRPAFVTWVVLLTLTLALVLTTAHLAEWRLARRIAGVLPPGTPTAPLLLGRGRARRARRWSLPVHHERPVPVLGAPPAAAAAAAAARPSFDEREPLLLDADDDAEHDSEPDATTLLLGEPDRGESRTRTSSRRARFAGVDSGRLRGVLALGSRDEDDDARGESVEAVLARADRTRVWIAVAYGATSGTLSGVCLLITKTGIDLLISTITSRENQFGHLEAWVIIAVLVVCELTQLAYLNRALRLVGPTLICPLAFCAYNCASIASGLIYFRQLDVLSALQGWMLALGTCVLLGGVWIVSVKPGGAKGESHEDGQKKGGQVWADEPLEMETEPDSCSSDDEPVVWRPRGFSIGLGAASPGFEIRPKVLHRAHASHSSAPVPSLDPSSPSPAASPSPYPSPFTPVIDLGASTASLPTDGRAAQRRRHGHGRSESLSGALYVGPSAHEHHHHPRHRREDSSPLPMGRARDGGEADGQHEHDDDEEEAKALRARGWWARVRSTLG